jgi:hypothetical protein
MTHIRGPCRTVAGENTMRRGRFAKGGSRNPPTHEPKGPVNSQMAQRLEMGDTMNKCESWHEHGAKTMAAQSADADERAALRRLATDPALVRVTKTAQYDLLGNELTTDEICLEIVAWIDAGQRVKKVVLRGQHAGAPAFEMKPRINDTLFYIKVALCDLETPDEYMLIISAHPDH